MENNWLRLKVGALALLSVVAINDTFGAYLPKIGASPLRFQMPQSFVATLMLPPLKRVDDIATTSGETNSVEQGASTNVVSGTALEPLGPPAPNPTNSPVPPPPVQLQTGPVVTPQMLLQFFTPASGTNAAAGMVMPSPFQMPQPPSSAAAYNSK